MTYEITVENIKCGGCAHTITSKLNNMDVIESCQVDVEITLGYPESGTAEGLKAAKARAKSFVSCAVGKISS